jgi:hypothetical protein
VGGGDHPQPTNSDAWKRRRGILRQKEVAVKMKDFSLWSQQKVPALTRHGGTRKEAGGHPDKD